jgi:hypothetical protein
MSIRTKHSDFKPLSEIVRSRAGRRLGRIFHRELVGAIEAYDRAGRSLGAFRTEKMARQAVRARHEARR